MYKEELVFPPEILNYIILFFFLNISLLVIHSLAVIIFAISFCISQSSFIKTIIKVLPSLFLRLCPFCTVIEDKQRKIWGSFNNLVAFESKHKVAEVHLLLLPQFHVEQRKGMEDLALLRQMLSFGEQLKVSRLIVHPPPFNSVNHFHVHALDGKFKNCYRDWAHSGCPPFSYTLEQLFARLIKK